MPKIYVATCNTPGRGLRFANGSLTSIKKTIGERHETEWTVSSYNLKADVATICLIIEALENLNPDESNDYVVTKSGQVRIEKKEANA